MTRDNVLDNYTNQGQWITNDMAVATAYINKHWVTGYNIYRFIDFSTISALFSDNFLYYDSFISNSKFNPFTLNCGEHCQETGSYPPIFQLSFYRADFTIEEEYTIQTFDMLLGVLGGFYGSIWLIFSTCLSKVEKFSRENELLTNFYSADHEIKKTGVEDKWYS